MVNNYAICISWSVLCIDCIAPLAVVDCVALLPLACFRSGQVSKGHRSAESIRTVGAPVPRRRGSRAGRRGAGGSRGAGAAHPLEPQLSP